MEDNSPALGVFVRRRLPWLIAGVTFALYLLTLNQWVGAKSLATTEEMAGWGKSLPYSHPLQWLLGLPLKFVPAASVPYAANLLAALLAAASLWTLARCVALLPHDRAREERMRDHVDNPLLHIRLAWIPPVFATLLLGLQLTFWEEATAQTGEMLDLLVFASCIRCLLEYRLELRESWLWRFALLMGLGIAGNWAMIGFAPFFLIALCWIRGLAILNAGFLLRLAAWFGLGLLAYLVMPLVSQMHGGWGNSVWGVLREALGTQKNYLFSLQRSRFLLLSLVMLLPLVLVGIRWGGAVGTRFESMLSSGAVGLFRVAFLGLAVYMAFDPVFSVRKLIRLDPQQAELPLLTFSFAAALAAAYFAGYFLLLGTSRPSSSWERGSGGGHGLVKLGAGLVLLLAVGTPTGLILRNLPLIRAQNGPLLSRFAEHLTSGLPTGPALVVTDDAQLHSLIGAHFRRSPAGEDRLLFNPNLAPLPEYRRLLAREQGNRWPELADFAAAQQGVAQPFMRLLLRAATNHAAFYLNPSVNFLTEQWQARSQGGIFRMYPYEAGHVEAAPLTAEEAASIKAHWDKIRPDLAAIIAAVKLEAPNPLVAARLWSRAANNDGVALQQSGRLEDAAALFDLALKLYPENLSTTINAQVNAALKAHKPIDDDIRKPLADKSLAAVVIQLGELDEPHSLYLIGRYYSTTEPPLPRAAATRFLRSRQLDPTNPASALAFISSLLNAGEPGMARNAIGELRASVPLKTEDTVKLIRLEFGTYAMMGKAGDMEKPLLKAHDAMPKETVSYDLLSQLYLQQNRFDEAQQQLGQWEQLQPDEPEIAERRVVIFMTRGQFDQALSLLDRILQHKSDNEVARANRAICLLQLNRLDDARRDYELLNDKHPDQYILHYGLGEIADRKKESPEALKHFRRYLELAPQSTLEFTNVLAKVSRLEGGK